MFLSVNKDMNNVIGHLCVRFWLLLVVVHKLVETVQPNPTKGAKNSHTNGWQICRWRTGRCRIALASEIQFLLNLFVKLQVNFDHF